MMPCMGGNCRERNWCPHYTAEDHLPLEMRSKPAERLCIDGIDGMLKSIEPMTALDRVVHASV